MENKSHAFAAGAFVLLVAALVAVLAFWLTRDTSVQREYEIASREGVTGLQPQASVRYKGVTVGRVTDIALDRNLPGNVLVRIAVNDTVPMTLSTFATLGFQGVTGLAFVQLDDTGTSTEPLVSRASEPLARIPMRAGMISRLTDQGTQLLGQLDQASQRVNGLLSPDNQKELMDAIRQLGQAAASVQQLSRRAEQVLAPAPGQTGLPQLMQQANGVLQSMQETSQRLGGSAESVKASADEFKRMSARMNAPGGTLDKIAEGADALVATGATLNATLVPRLNRTAADATRVVRQVGRAVDTVNDNPKSLFLGKEGAAPGPGERGFVAPGTR